MKYAFISIFLASLFFISCYALCTRPNHQHVNKEITRCRYIQDDIREAQYDRDARRNHENPRYQPDANACFYCGCPIGDHTEKPVS